MNFIEIVIALLLVGFVGVFITWLLSFFAFLPSIFIVFLGLFIAINLVLFVIHRK